MNDHSLYTSGDWNRRAIDTLDAMQEHAEREGHKERARELREFIRRAQAGEYRDVFFAPVAAGMTGRTWQHGTIP